MNKDDAVAQGTPSYCEVNHVGRAIYECTVAELDAAKAENAALSAQVAAGNIVIECCYAELKKALGRDIECPAYIPDAIRELSAQVVELQAKLKFLTENCDCKEIV